MKVLTIGQHRCFHWSLLFVLLIFLIGTGCTAEKKAEPGLQPPVAKKIPKELTIHGDTRVDDYYWLKERNNPEVIAYLEAENFYKDAVLKHTQNFQEKLFTEIIDRIKQTDMSVPYKTNGYYYYTRYEEGKEYPLYCRKEGSLEAKEEVFLNVNRMAEGFDYFHVMGYSVSENNELVSFGVDTVGRERYTLYFKNLKTGETYEDTIPNTSGSAEWANDNKSVFYAVKDDTLRPYKILKHILGTEISKDEDVFEEEDVTFSCRIGKSKSRDYIMILSDQTLSTEYRFLDADNPGGEFKTIQPREHDMIYYKVKQFQDKFYIRTNYNAKNFRLMETSVDDTGKGKWTEVIPHRQDVLLEDFEIFHDFLALKERKAGLTQFRIIRWDDRSEHYLDFSEEAYVADISTNPDFDTDLLRYDYTSLTTPRSTYDYNMKTREKTLLKREEVGGDFNPDNYITERLYATAKDGVKIPVSLVYRKGLEKSGNHPLFLLGYGSYGASEDPEFELHRLSLLDRGIVYAIAHVRGGQEMGRWWYEYGKLLKKKNTFSDFIACAEHLIAEKYTNPDMLFAAGGSAGGLLMGVVVNMRPDLFKGVIAAVPFVDVVTTMLDPSLALTTFEYDEWGNPENKEYYDYMLSYSPYDNVEAKDYPAMLVTAGLQDSRVQYWEPAKWVAKLRALKTDDNILLLHTNIGAGHHTGVSGRFKQYRDWVLYYVFVLDLLGIKE